MTIMLIPFMSCTAKYPIYGFFVAAFFPGKGALIVLALYLVGILVGIITAVVAKYTAFRGEAVPFVMELPNYRMPGIKNVAKLLWEKAKDFITKAFTIIFVATIVIWFLRTFTVQMDIASNPHQSILAQVAGLIAPVFKPMGFGDWRVVTALITGFMAKESVVSTLSILFGETEVLVSSISHASVIALMIFCLLYTPCVAAIASVKRELGAKWAAGMVLLQCAIAWVVSFLAYLLMSAILA